ncbi:hypothetical protein D1159_03705 [Pseudoflavonifractor sp. 524-17]|uniref:hypothetical protein n=1 Tax=Pseudoflavonifractor sp. 524-17 TaxID=2304577 RepID=UPI00137B02A8|nr:hypothetical protein [Pseudoflavonifractor sp. 524-17]NCE63705.1 hypothetical protein [Pseudoflavonifractor sp. 524-17]
MERLTIKSIFGGWTIHVPRQEAIDRLAAYEDTGLSPETVSDPLERFTYFYRTVEGLDLVDPVHFGAFVDRVKRWQQAEKDGRLMVLPVKEGAKIYRVRFNFDGNCYEIIEKDFDLGFFRPGDFGRIIFRTREEAEAALKKREEEDNDS